LLQQYSSSNKAEMC